MATSFSDNDVKLLQRAKLKLSPDRRFMYFGVLMATFLQSLQLHCETVDVLCVLFSSLLIFRLRL